MLAIPAIHVAILVCAETLVRQDPRFVWLVGLAIVVEFAAAIILIERQNANFTLSKDAAAQPVLTRDGPTSGAKASWYYALYEHAHGLIVHRGTIFATTSNGCAYGIDLRTGRRRWWPTGLVPTTTTSAPLSPTRAASPATILPHR